MINELKPVEGAEQLDNFMLMDNIKEANYSLALILQHMLTKTKNDKCLQVIRKLSNQLKDHATLCHEKFQETINSLQKPSTAGDHVEKLQKTMNKIENDLEEKDKALLDQEHQLMMLTDQFESKQQEVKLLKEKIQGLEV